MATIKTDLLSQLKAKGRQIDEMNERLKELKGEFEKYVQSQKCSPRWWQDHAGRFEKDPLFDEIARLGRRERFAERSRARKLERTRAGS
ncbi:MAG TPA: hypothetical protein VHX86_08330 [Tepidisphaeraceae bacterium]|jgi:hypothetical protein|nr:hypothetical protein [Tepidisphaeraceae bacterium]